MAIKPEEVQVDRSWIVRQANALEQSIDEGLLEHDFETGSFIYPLGRQVDRRVGVILRQRFRGAGWTVHYHYGWDHSEIAPSRFWNDLELRPRNPSLWARVASLWRSRA